MVTENVNIIVSLRGATRAARSLGRIGRSARGATASVRGLGLALAVAVGVGSVRGLLRLADAATEVSNRVRVTTETTEQFLAVQSELFRVAQKTGGSIEDTSRLFQRLRVGTRDLGVSSQRVIDVVEGLNAAILVSGSSAREASAALLQLGQGIASDNLSGEELRSLRENLPPLAQGIADVLDTTIGGLKALGRTGKLTAEEVFGALEVATKTFIDQVERGDVILTFAQAFNILRNEVIKFFEIIQRATGINNEFNKVVLKFTDGLAERMAVLLARLIRRFVALKVGFNSVLISGKNVFTVIKAVGTALGTLGNIAVTIAATLATPFLKLMKEVLVFQAGIVKAKLIVFDTEENFKKLADLNKRIAEADQNLDGTLGLIAEQLASGFSTNLFEGLLEDVQNVNAEMSDLDKLLLSIANGIEKTATTPAPKVKDLTGPGPGFLERAAARTSKNETESGFEPAVFEKDLAASVTDSLRQGIRAAVTGEGDIFETISASLENAAEEALLKGFEKSLNDLQGILEESFDVVAKKLTGALKNVFPEISDGLQQALQGAVQFAALQALSAITGGGKGSQSGSSKNLSSAVTSTQAVRGIVAGPQSIAIAEISNDIARAVEPLVVNGQIANGLLSQIVVGVQEIGAGGGGGGGASDQLAFQPPAA